MKTLAIYARVSTKEQTNENQIIRLKEYVQSKGYDYEIFTETQSSRKSRPIKNMVLQLLRKKVFDGVVVYKLDRWARSSTELLLEIEELISKGIEFHSYSENIDFNSAVGKLHFSILSAFAEFERELIRERTLEGLNRAKVNGKKLGRPKGSKDKKKRKKGGYYLRHSTTK